MIGLGVDRLQSDHLTDSRFLTHSDFRLCAGDESGRVRLKMKDIIAKLRFTNFGSIRKT